MSIRVCDVGSLGLVVLDAVMLSSAALPRTVEPTTVEESTTQDGPATLIVDTEDDDGVVFNRSLWTFTNTSSGYEPYKGVHRVQSSLVPACVTFRFPILHQGFIVH